MQKNRISKFSARPSPPCTCLVLERGHAAAHEFVDEMPDLDFVRLRFTRCEVVIVIRTPDGVINSVGCERQDTLHAIQHAQEEFVGRSDARWGVLCSPPLALAAMTLFNGGYNNLMASA